MTITKLSGYVAAVLKEAQKNTCSHIFTQTLNHRCGHHNIKEGHVQSDLQIWSLRENFLIPSVRSTNNAARYQKVLRTQRYEQSCSGDHS